MLECQCREIAPCNGKHNTEVITSEYLALCRHEFARAKVKLCPLTLWFFYKNIVTFILVLYSLMWELPAICAHLNGN